jgi:hypothetical protein
MIKKIEIRWRGERNGGRKNIKEKIDYRGYTEILFSTHSVLLKTSQWNNSNCTL